MDEREGEETKGDETLRWLISGYLNPLVFYLGIEKMLLSVKEGIR
jgi:hypothetical protein